MFENESTHDRVSQLSAAKRLLLQKRLHGESIKALKRPHIPRRIDINPPRLSFAQQRLWFLSQIEPDSTAYNIPVGLRMQGKLNVTALQQSLNEICRRHEALRTIFKEINGFPRQVILPPSDTELPTVDLKELPADKREREVQRLIIEEAQRPFDLSQVPLLRAKLMRLGEQEHVLILTMHHIISDGWSMAIFTRELTVLYEAFSNEAPSPLPELPIQYADFAVWQRLWLQGEVLEKQLSYWKQQLGVKLPVLQLPTDRPRPSVQTHQGAREIFVLSEHLKKELNKLSRREGVTLFMTLLAAFATLLYRYTGQEDFKIGSPIANRNQPEIENLIGFFVNTLVLRNDLSGNPTFKELLGRVREVTLDAYDHQDLPFEKLVEVVNPAREMSYSPLFQVMFVLQNMPGAEVQLPGLRLSSVAIDRGASMFDLTLFMWGRDQGLSGSVEYNTDLFDAERIERMVGHFQTLLEGIVADPDQRISDVQILTDTERQQLLVDWNDTAVEYPRDKCIHELFEKQVERTPDAAAVIYGKQRLTYRELNTRANQLAHYLQALGVGPDVLVGICVERGLEMLIGLLGILKAGGAYVPLDPDHPEQRIRYMLESAEISVLLTQKGLKSNLPVSNINVICLDGDWEKISKESNKKLSNKTKPNNLAYVIFTSGSTGKPKGIKVPHKAVVNFLTSMSRKPGLTAQDVLVAVTTISFDIHVLELYLPLIVGATTVVVSREMASDGGQLLEVLNTSGATVMQATPATWRILISAGWQGSEQLKVLCGGEAFPHDLARDLLKRSPNVWNMFGPTETTVWSTCYRLTDPDGPILIGRPIDNTQIFILDKFMQPVPVGVRGELCISGDGVTFGYLNRPDLTAKQFVSDLFREDPDALIYKTGDLCIHHPDGNIEYLNRIDNQVQVRGFRIELGEIEAVLGEHDAIKQGVVAVREERPGDTRLVAYFVSKPDRNIVTTELRGHLRTKLPDYMIPQHFVELELMPLTPAGKVDRKALPKPEADGSLEQSYVAPRSPIEELLANIWAEVLGIEKIGIHDSFFDLGGHSLLTTKVISRLRDSDYSVDMPIRRLFDYPTLEAFAEQVTLTLLNQEEMGKLIGEIKNLSEDMDRKLKEI